MRAASLIVLPLALALAGCGGGEGTEISLNVQDPNGGFNASAAKDGTVSVDAPGFKGAVKLPRIQLDAEDFDINGVHLPPGSTIKALNVAGKPGEDGVRVTFTSPIAPAAVRDWFLARLNAEGFRLSAQGEGLAGTTDDDQSFTLTTKPSGAGSESVIAIGR